MSLLQRLLRPRRENASEAPPPARDAASQFAERGALLLGEGRILEARAACDRAESLGAASAELLLRSGRIHLMTGDLDGAEARLRKAIELSPAMSEAHHQCGIVARARNRNEDAARCFTRALELEPQHLDALTMLGRCRADLGDLGEAEALFRRVVAVDPAHAAAWNHLGLTLAREERHAEALEAFERARDLERPDDDAADAYTNLGVALADAGRLDEALAVFEGGLATRPTAAAHFNYAIALLRAGRLRDGWGHHEFRWLMEPLHSLRLAVRAPQWTGQDLRGRTLLVRAEQGFGDTLLCLRYAPLLKALGANVVVRVQAGLEAVARHVAGVDRVLERGEENPPFDCYVHTLSLPRVFATDLQTIPAGVPYVRADPERAARWARTFADERRLKVGLIWAGSPGHLKDRHRSIALSDLAPILEVADVAFVALQKGPQRAELDAAALRSSLLDVGHELDDFADTAAVVANLDLLISVDTAPVHLAGAMGRPVWVLLPAPCDWRWLEAREDSPWYPTLRLFRQTRRGDWDEVIERVAMTLRERVAERAASPPLSAPRTPPVDAESRATAEPGSRPPPPDRPPFSAVTHARPGLVQYLPQDLPSGEAIRRYGEWLEPQLALLQSAVRPGATVVEAGAGTGLRTLALAAAVGEAGLVLAYEARPLHARILRQNLDAHGARRVTVMRRMLGAIREGERSEGGRPEARHVAVDTVDGLALERLDLLVIDRGTETASILEGAAESLWRLRPVLFVAAGGDEFAALSDRVRPFGFRCWRMETPLFSAENFNRRADNVFGDRSALALVATPEETDAAWVVGRCVEVRA